MNKYKVLSLNSAIASNWSFLYSEDPVMGSFPPGLMNVGVPYPAVTRRFDFVNFHAKRSTQRYAIC